MSNLPKVVQKELEIVAVIERLSIDEAAERKAIADRLGSLTLNQIIALKEAAGANIITHSGGILMVRCNELSEEDRGIASFIRRKLERRADFEANANRISINHRADGYADGFVAACDMIAHLIEDVDPQNSEDTVSVDLILKRFSKMETELE